MRALIPRQFSFTCKRLKEVLKVGVALFIVKKSKCETLETINKRDNAANISCATPPCILLLCFVATRTYSQSGKMKVYKYYSLHCVEKVQYCKYMWRGNEKNQEE